MSQVQHQRAKEAIAAKFPLNRSLSAIPKIVHQTSPSLHSMHPDLSASINSLKNRNPGWDIRHYDDTEAELFILQHYGEDVLSQYLRIDPAYGAARADLFRYLCLYNCGGVYLDIKSTVEKPLDEVILPDDQFLLSQWRNEAAGWGLHRQLSHIPGGEYQQWYIISAAGHPFLKYVILHVLENIQEYCPITDGVGRVAVLALTGPIAYTLAIQPIRMRHPHRFTDICIENSFKYSIYSTATTEHFKLFPNHYSNLTTPIVKINLPKHVVWNTYRAIRKIYRAFKKIRLSLQNSAPPSAQP